VVVAIAQGQVTLRRADGREQLLPVDPPDDPPESSPPAPRASRRDGVERLGTDHVAVDRDLIDRLTNDPSELARLGRARAHRGPGGEVVGYRLSGIGRRSLGRKLGLRSGDVVHAVEGHDLTSMSAAMKAWNALRDADAVEVEFSRRGAKRTLTVDII